MVPIPADPQRVLEDECACEAILEESLFNRHMLAGEALFSLSNLSLNGELHGKRLECHGLWSAALTGSFLGRSPGLWPGFYTRTRFKKRHGEYG